MATPHQSAEDQETAAQGFAKDNLPIVIVVVVVAVIAANIIVVVVVVVIVSLLW